MLSINEVHQGDCLELMKEIPDKSVDMVLCDLPYGITNCKWDTCIDLDLLWLQYKRIIKEKGAIVLTATNPFGARLIMSNPKWFRHEWIWEKDNGSNFFNVKVMPLRVHESVLVFGRHGVAYSPQMNTGKPYITKSKGPLTHVMPTERIATINLGTRYPRSVIKFNRDYGKLIHTTQKPVALFEHLIRSYSNQEALILDNCSGSGTTAIAAINTNRNYICIEKDQKYVDSSSQRINALKKYKEERT